MKKEIYKVLARILAFAFCLFLASPLIAGNFQVFDGTTGYKTPPQTTLGDLKRLEIAYAWQLWGPKPAGVKNEEWPPMDLSQENERHIRDLAKTWAEKKIDLVCLDIEHWHVSHADESAEKGVDNFKRVIGWIRQEDPSLKIGIFGIIPIRDANRALCDPDSVAYQYWHSKNEKLKAIADQVDVIFPSLYTFLRDPDQWKTFAVATIREARAYGKPVYPFVWPRYFDKSDFLPQVFWALELKTVMECADGIVIWDGVKNSDWDDEADWWKTTQTVLWTENAGAKGK
jgi:hypothetical protein